MSERTALVTGGAGFIGTRLAARLVASGWHVVAADVLHPQVHSADGWPSALPAEATAYPIDVTSASACAALLRLVRPDVLVHLAAETGTEQSLREASRHADVNVLGTARLLDACTRAGHTPEHIVLASSRAVYGEGRWRAGDTPFYAEPRSAAQLAEGRWDPAPAVGAVGADVEPLAHDATTTEPRPSNVYAATKLAQEHVLRAWTASMGARLSVLRLQNVYGPGQSLTNPYTGIVSLFVQRALRGEPIDVYEDGRIVRDFVFIDDVVAALALTVGGDAELTVPVDIGSGEPLTLEAMACTIAAKVDAPPPFVSGRYRLGDVRAAWADVRPAHDALGYVPSTAFSDGIEQLIAWVRSVADTTPSST